MWTNSFRFYCVKVIAYLVNKLINNFKLGTGLTWPGHIALMLYPDVLSDKHISFTKGLVFISGTNGKTTTSKLITTLLCKNGYSVIHNDSGANLLNGVVTACLLNKSVADFGVFEIDEFNLPIVMSYKLPSALILLNLSRDQLDRYGETDVIFERWLTAIASLPQSAFLLINSDQHNFHKFQKIFNGRTLYFDGNLTYLNQTKFKGDFNAYNINAALALSAIFNLDEAKSIEAISTVDTAFGRGEVVSRDSVTYTIFLNKNPQSANNNLTFISSAVYDSVVFMLNDKIPDGRDVSWIYDIQPQLLKQFCLDLPVFVCGTRAEDMYIRLCYAGINPGNINLITDLTQFLQQKIYKNIICFPNYSAMLDMRKLLLGRKIL